jgi:hypothetical protein
MSDGGAGRLPTLPRGDHACIDIEFGYVYGTSRAVIMPVEIGAVIYRPSNGCAVEFTGEQFCYDIEYEVWKKVTDDCGRTIGVSTSVFNNAAGECGKAYSHAFRLPGSRMAGAREVARSAFEDLRRFMENLLSSGDTPALIFFAAEMERKAFLRAGIPLQSFEVIDLQQQVKRALQMKEHLSLDRISRFIGFRTTAEGIASDHFAYPVPQEYRTLLDPHRGMGDAARIFMLSREFAENRSEFLERIRAVVAHCDECDGECTNRFLNGDRKNGVRE